MGAIKTNQCVRNSLISHNYVIFLLTCSLGLNNFHFDDDNIVTKIWQIKTILLMLLNVLEKFKLYSLT